MNIIFENENDALITTKGLGEMFISELKDVEEKQYTLSIKASKRDILICVDGKNVFGLTTTSNAKQFKLYGVGNENSKNLYLLDTTRRKAIEREIEEKKALGIDLDINKIEKLIEDDFNKDGKRKITILSCLAGDGKNSCHSSMTSVVKEMFHLIDVYLCILAYKKNELEETAYTEMTEDLASKEETKTEVKEETPKKRRNSKK